MTSSSAIYLRVSREDLDEEKQHIAIQQKFKIADAVIFREKVSAYDELAQEDRAEFQQLKRQILDGSITDVYIFSVERLERNIIRLFEFYFFCEAYGCKIYSVNQEIPNREADEKPIQTFMRYINVLLFGYKGQEESYTISYRTKSAVEVNDQNNTYSYKGKKWGKQFKDLNGSNVDIKEEELENIQKSIMTTITRYEKEGKKGYYPQIVELIAKKYNIKISKAYVSVLKNGGHNK